LKREFCYLKRGFALWKGNFAIWKGCFAIWRVTKSCYIMTQCFYWYWLAIPRSIFKYHSSGENWSFAKILCKNEFCPKTCTSVFIYIPNCWVFHTRMTSC
jgi:hypothetical protein